MSYNTKNYTEQGGDVTHFGGTVIFEEGVTVEGGSFTEVKTGSKAQKGILKVGNGLNVNSGTVSVAPAENDALGGVKVGTGLEVDTDGTLSVTPTPDADPDTKGLVKQAEAVADAVGDAPTAEEYNALLAALRTAGIIATATEE